MRTFRIALLPGDGIGPEVVAEAIRVLDAVQARGVAAALTSLRHQQLLQRDKSSICEKNAHAGSSGRCQTSTDEEHTDQPAHSDARDE